MSGNTTSDPSDFVNEVIEAFDEMRVPPPPPLADTTQWLASHGRPPLPLEEGRRGEGAPRSDAPRAWRQRLVVGGLGLSAAAGLVWLLLALTLGSRLSAMEQMVEKLQEVKSFSYKLSTQNTYVKPGHTEPTRVVRTGQAWWVEPGSLRAAERIVEQSAHGDTAQPDKLLVDIVEIYPAGQPGILIDHLAKTFVRLPVLRREDIPAYSPLSRLRRVRERQGRFVRELAPRVIDGKRARGYVMAFDEATPDSGRDNVEVWLDPQTNLPLAFGYTIKNDAGPEFFRVTDCRWNVDAAPKLFDATPPPGYREVAPPPSE